MNTIQYVKVLPTKDHNDSPYFLSNAHIGDVVLFKKSSSLLSHMLHTPAIVIDETPFFLVLDFGMYRFCALKASIYCKDDILYFQP